jgi:hypothetical protein
VLAWQVTQHIRAIFEDYKISRLITPVGKVSLSLLERIGQTKNYEELKALWLSTKSDWGDEHVAAANLQREFF